MSNMRPVTLQEITTSIFDGKHGDCVDLPGSGLYFISVKDLKEYDIDYSNAREITPEDFAQNYLRTSLENGDTIYANTGDTIGKSLFVERNNLADKTSFQKSVAVLKPNAEMVEPRYLYYLLKYETPRLRQAATGSGQKNLLLSTMRDFETRIHDRETQSKIVAVLGCIDQKIHTNLSINDNLEATAQALYQELFIDNSEIFSWKQGTVGDVLQLQRGHDLPRTEMLGGEYPVAGSTGTIGYHNKFTAEAPVIVMGRSGNIGNPRLYLCNCWTHNTSLYVKQIFHSEPIWAFYLLKNLNYDGFVGGSAVPTLNRNDVHAYGIAIPPLELQKSFSEKVIKLILRKEENLLEITKLQELQGTILATISSR